MYTHIPKLGFGMMRLPMNGAEVDIEQTKKMVDRFIDAGFTYFDTARGYIDGLSERAVKTALTDRYPRDAYLLADNRGNELLISTVENMLIFFNILRMVKPENNCHKENRKHTCKYS